MLSRTLKPGRSVAAALVSKLPDDRVALRPDSWDLAPGGDVLVRYSRSMAEARGWCALADHGGSRDDGRRAISVHGIFVRRAIVDLADRRFLSEEAASVAVQLFAREWVAERRLERVCSGSRNQAAHFTVAMRGRR